MEAVSKRFLVSIGIFFCFCIVTEASEAIKEIRLQGIGGYSQHRFVLTIRDDGTVKYEGISFVAVEGKRQSKISSEDFQRLVRKLAQIHFFKLEDRSNDYPLDKPSPVSASGEVTVEHTFVTDQRTEIITVVTDNRSKSVEDYMGAPKGLFELEQLILDLANARKWTGDLYDRDVPYYDKFPLNMQVTYRVLLESYRRSSDTKRIAGYYLWFINNKGVNFDVKLQRAIDLKKYDTYLVDATGEIKKTQAAEPQFFLADIHPVRRYFPASTH